MLRLKSATQNLLKNIGPFFRTHNHGYRPVILFFLLPFGLYLLFSTIPAVEAKTVTIGWDSNPEPDLEGYVVYRNTASPGPPYNYSDELPEDELADPLHPQATLTGLQEGKEYYVALTAYNTEGVESGFSNDVCVEVVNGVVEPCSASSSPIASTASSTGGGGSGGGCFISSVSGGPSAFTRFVAGPIIRSQAGVLILLCLILIVAVRLESNKANPSN